MKSSALEKYDILVVEDSPTQAESLRSLLEAYKAHVIVVKSGEEALDFLKSNHVDLVMTDIMMPGISGYELCKTIKSDSLLARIPVVLLTSLTDPVDTIRGLEAGADNYITKPYHDKRLVERLLTLFSRCTERKDSSTSDGETAEIRFLGEKFQVKSGKQQILDFLVSSFEDLVRTNEALKISEAERVQLYNREKSARLEAEDANQAKSEFLAAMSHDLRTPLNAIGGYAALLSEEISGPLTDAQRSYLDRIGRNQKHLLALVNDVLNFARVERGQVSIEKTDVLVIDILNDVRAMIEPQANSKGLLYDVEGCEELLVSTDRERTEQILMNLLTNAIKFTLPGGQIRVVCEPQEDFVSIAVQDTGPGMPEDKLNVIFDPFVQVNASRATEQQGVGLGLAISRNLARLLGGELTVTSKMGEGSSFRLQLPKAK